MHSIGINLVEDLVLSVHAQIIYLESSLETLHESFHEFTLYYTDKKLFFERTITLLVDS